MDFKTEYFDIWMIAWSFHKKYAVMEKMDWELVVDESASIIDNYNNKPSQKFVKDLLVAVLKELERRGSDA